jgi:FkbM family methyltransferase
MELKVLHLALTPLAGAPIRIVTALNAFTGIQARLINLNPRAYGTRTYPEDIDFSTQPDLARDLIESADLIHLHHWIDLAHNPFGVDLRGKRVIRQFHSHPAWIARHAGVDVEAVIADPLPQLVIAQFHERFYPRARPVPNLLNAADLQASAAAAVVAPPGAPLRVAYQPTVDTSALQQRWDTKGKPETLTWLQRIAANLPLEIDCAGDLPYSEALARKARADVVLDELVTGSYHLSSLEGLALGKPTFAYLDARMVAVLAALTGSSALPWINTHLTTVEGPLRDLHADPALRAEIGAAGRAWIERHWDSAKLIQHFVSAYRDVSAGRACLREPNEARYVAVNLPNVDWSVRSQLLEEMLNAGTQTAVANCHDAVPAAGETAERLLLPGPGAGSVVLQVGGKNFAAADHWFWPEFAAGWEKDTERVYAAFMRPDRDVVDVGAWVGATVMFAAAYGARRIVAIEPNPLSADRLEDLRQRNPELAAQLHIVREGVAATAGEIEFGTVDGALSDSSACSVNGRGMRIKVRPLAAIMAQFDDLNPVLIKIDIEGAEFLLAPEIEALARLTDCAVLLSLHPPFKPEGARFADLIGALEAFDLIDLNARPIAHGEVAARLQSSEPKPAWGTRFGNFFEVLLLPRAAAIPSTLPADGAAASVQRADAIETQTI